MNYAKLFAKAWDITEKARKRNEPDPFGPRIRFNWGYHDARYDKERGHTDRRTLTGQDTKTGMYPLPKDTPHHQHYAAGYGHGWESDLKNPEHELSTHAWQKHTGNPNARP